jgi:HK97 family phage major capsid protein
MKNPHEIETELKAEREHVARILDRAGLAGRNLLASEQRDFDSRMAKVKGLTDELELRWAESKRANMTARDEATQREAELREQSSRTNAPPAFMGDTRTMGSDSPMGEWLVRALVGGSGSGAPFAPNELSTTVFNYLRAKSVLMQAGATVINTDRHAISFPAISAGATAAWYGEGDTITASDMTAATVTATPRKVAILQTVSNELALDSLPSIWEATASNAVSQVALKMDAGFFEGSGTSNQVTGLKNVSGINTGTASGANGSTVTLDFVASGIAALQQSNANPTAIIMNPKLWATLSTVKDSSGRYLSQATSSSIASMSVVGRRRSTS